MTAGRDGRDKFQVCLSYEVVTVTQKILYIRKHGSQRQLKISRLALLSLPWTRTRTASSRRRTLSAAFPASVKLRLFPFFKGKSQPSSRLMRASRSLTRTKTGCSTLSSSRTSWGSGSLCQTRWIGKKHLIVSTGYNCWLLICHVDCWPLITMIIVNFFLQALARCTSTLSLRWASHQFSYSHFSCCCGIGYILYRRLGRLGHKGAKNNYSNDIISWIAISTNATTTSVKGEYQVCW